MNDYYAQVDKVTSKIPNCCTRGCHACCDEPAYADAREVKAMLALIPEKDLEMLKVRVRLWLAHFRYHGFHKEERPKAFVYRLQELHCPFLVNGECSVYVARPFGCRVFLAKENPASCNMPARVHQKFAEFPIELTAAMLMPLLNAPGTIVMDHIGVLAANLLDIDECKSASRMEMSPCGQLVSGKK